MRQSWAMPKILPHQSQSDPLKVTDWLGQNQQYHNWTRSLEINTAAYMRGFHQSYFIFHRLHAASYRKKKNLQFQNGMNYRFHSHYSYSPPASSCPLFSSLLPLTCTPLSVKGKHECFLCSVGGEGRWVVLTFELLYFICFRSLLRAIYFTCFGKRSL